MEKTPERDARCPWCSRSFKGTRGLRTHLGMSADCSWIASTAEEALMRLRCELDAVRRDVGRQYEAARAGNLDRDGVTALARAIAHAVKLAKWVSSEELETELRTWAVRMGETDFEGVTGALVGLGATPEQARQAHRCAMDAIARRSSSSMAP